MWPYRKKYRSVDRVRGWKPPDLSECIRIYYGRGLHQSGSEFNTSYIGMTLAQVAADIEAKLNFLSVAVYGTRPERPTGQMTSNYRNLETSDQLQAGDIIDVVENMSHVAATSPFLRSDVAARQQARQEARRQYDHPSTAMGYVYGFRAYTYEPGSKFLLGGYNTKWYAPRQRARCRPGHYDALRARQFADLPPPHPAPCKCGINMYRTAVGAEEWVSGYRTDAEGFPVIALTRGWDRVIEHEAGFRVGHAEVIAVRLGVLVELPPGWADIPILDPAAFHQFSEQMRSEQLIEIPTSEGV